MQALQAQLQQGLNRLEALSGRERTMLLVMVPVTLALLGELLVFDPARKLASDAIKQAEQQQIEIKGLTAVLAAKPVAAPLPGAEQLQRQRDALLEPIRAAKLISSRATQSIDWGTVVRASMTGRAGLALAQLKTLPAEVVYSSATTATTATTAAKPTTLPAVPAAAAAAPTDTPFTVYRHRAELTLKGDLASVLAYLQALQRVEGGLHWDRLQMGMEAYPLASVQLSLYTLSNRAETPFY